MDITYSSSQDNPRPRTSSSPTRPSSLDTRLVTSEHDAAMAGTSRVTTPSSPGSTSGESLSGAGDDSDNPHHPRQQQSPSPTRASTSTSASAVLQGGNHHHQGHSSTTVLAGSSTGSNTVHASTSSSTNRGTISSRRRHHHHHHHTLTLGTGSAKMGSSITDSAQSTEDEMYEDEESEGGNLLEEDTEDDRPRILYPALATPKAAGNNYWPFGTTNDAERTEENEASDNNMDGAHPPESSHNHHHPHSSNQAGSSSHSQAMEAGPSSSSSSTNLQRRQTLTSSTYTNNTPSTSATAPVHDSQSESASLAAYRSQIQAPSGANAAFLPHEILLKILRNVRQTEDLVSALQVCKSWCQCGVELLWNKPLFPNVGPLIKMLVILSKGPTSSSSTIPQSNNNNNVISTGTSSFPYASFIKRLNFSQLADKMSDALLIRLNVCTKLERLTLAGCLEITDLSLINLLSHGGGKNLVALDLSDCSKITDESVIEASRYCKRLQGLNLSGCKLVTDEGVKAIAKGCPLLRRVKLRNLDTLTDDAIISLALSCPLLLEVDLYACTSITDRTLWALFRNSSHLRELSLNNCTQVTGDGFPQRDGKLLYIKGAEDPALLGLKPLNNKLVNLPSKILDAHGNFSSLSDPSLSKSNTTPLGSRIFDHVRYLDLTGMVNLNDVAMAGIVATMPHVRNLVLAKCSNLTDESVMSICKLGKHIHFLHLGHVSNITDKAVTTLARACTRLRYIDLACCPNLTDLSVFELASNLPRLKRIGLVRVSNLTDQAIFALAERTTLERIHLSYCENVSVSAVQFLLSRLSRLNHLSLTGVPAFRRADLQHFCRPPPKDFNPHQRSTFCVYSGKGVHELRKHLMALQQYEQAAGMNGTGTLIPPASVWQHNAHQYHQPPPHTLHHQQFAQLQLGNAQQHQQLPTYPHLFQHPSGHAVVSQMPLQAQQDDGEDVDEDADEEDDDNGDDEADEDNSMIGTHSPSSRRNQHSNQQHHHGSSQAQSSHSHNHHHHPSSNGQHSQSGSSTQRVNGNSASQTTQTRHYEPVAFYRGNHRMTSQSGELLDGSGSPPFSEAGATTTGNPSSLPQSNMPAYPQSFYSTELQPPLAQLSYQTNFHQTLPSDPPPPNAAWLSQVTGNEPTTQIRVPQVVLQARTRNAGSPQNGRPTSSSSPFTPVRSPHASRPTSSASSSGQANASAQQDRLAFPSSSAFSSQEMDLMDLQDAPDIRQRSHSVEMDLNTEDQTQGTSESPDGEQSRLMRPRRDTIMQSNYRQED